MRISNPFLLAAVMILALYRAVFSAPYVVYQGTSGPGVGKNILFIAGDEEYRSEESLPMLAKILAVHYGFKCTVLFAQDPATGDIDPNDLNNIPGLSLLAQADLMVILTRFRELPDADMKLFDDYVNSGKPIIGLRTATHAFKYVLHRNSPYVRYDFQSTIWDGGFGRQVLGETWINHWGSHGSQSTRGILRDSMKNHPILTGVTDIWVPTDVYEIKQLTGDAQVLVDGHVLTGMKPTDPPLAGKATMPIAWIRTFTGTSHKPARIFTTTMGAAVDFQSEGLRRMLINASFWGLGLEASIPPKANVDFVGAYAPLPFAFNLFKKYVKPEDLALPIESAIGAKSRSNPARAAQVPVLMRPGYRSEHDLNGRLETQDWNWEAGFTLGSP